MAESAEVVGGNLQTLPDPPEPPAEDTPKGPEVPDDAATPGTTDTRPEDRGGSGWT